jgi:hypothetical protein
MSYTTTGATNQNIDFGSVSAVKGLTNKTIIVTYKETALPGTAKFIGRLAGVSAYTDEWFSVYTLTLSSASRFVFSVDWSNSATWVVSPGAINNVYQVAVTYNSSSTANDPIMYVNGVSASVSETVTPSGTLATGTNAPFILASSASTASITGDTYNFLIYNRILSAAEILDAYNSRLAIPSYNGLVFAPELRGAAGGVGDGSTLAAGNVIRDHISGASGVPAGSPVLRADTYLNYK